jgi:hypothetical protein
MNYTILAIFGRFGAGWGSVLIRKEILELYGIG